MHAPRMTGNGIAIFSVSCQGERPIGVALQSALRKTLYATTVHTVQLVCGINQRAQARETSQLTAAGLGQSGNKSAYTPSSFVSTLHRFLRRAEANEKVGDNQPRTPTAEG